MTYKQMCKAFEKFGDEEYIEFERVENKRSTRPDLHAFLLLAELFPSDSDIVSGASHDEIYLDIGAEELAKKANEGIILELVRCGVRFDGETDSLAMFV